MIAVSSGLVPSPALTWLMSAPPSSSAVGGFEVALARGVQQRRHAALGRDRRIDLFGIEVADVRIDRRVRIAAAESCPSARSRGPLRSRPAPGSASALPSESLPMKPSITLRCRSAAARSSALNLAMSMTLVVDRRIGAAREQRLDRLGAIAGRPRRSAASGRASDSFALTSALASASRLMTSALPDERGQVHRRHAAVGWSCALTSAPALMSALATRRAARLGGEVERRVLADARHRADVGAGVDQHVGELGVAALGRPVQRAHAVALRAVDVGAVLEQLPTAALSPRTAASATRRRPAARQGSRQTSAINANRLTLHRSVDSDRI